MEVGDGAKLIAQRKNKTQERCEWLERAPNAWRDPLPIAPHEKWLPTRLLEEVAYEAKGPFP